MKKVRNGFSLCLALVLVLLVCVPVFAADDKNPDESVPVMLAPEREAYIISKTGQVLMNLSVDDVSLTPYGLFSDEQLAVYDELLDYPTVPIYEEATSAANPDKTITVNPENENREDYVFDFNLKGEAKTRFENAENENGVVVNLEFLLEDQSLTDEIVVLQYINGEWLALDPKFYTASGGILDVDLEHEGMMAIFRVGMRETTNYVTVEEQIYRPSVGFIGYPRTITSEPGYFYVLESVFARYNDPMDKIPENEVKLVPAALFNADQRAAYDLLAQAHSLDTVCKDFDIFLEDFYPGTDVGNLVVRDIFDFQLSEEASLVLHSNEDSCLLLRFRYDIKEGDVFVVLQYNGEEWGTLDKSSFSVEDGIVSVLLKDAGMIAFVVEGK